jgi:hypothetical protein
MPNTITIADKNHSTGELIMMEIQSLTSRIHDLQRAFDFWTTGYVWLVAITVFLAIALFLTQFMSVRRGKELTQAQTELAAVRDRQLTMDLKEKDEKIAEANARAAESLLALERFKKPRRLSSEQHALLVENLKRFAGTEYDLAANDPESLDFALDIERALGDAGWTIRSWTDEGIVTTLPGRSFCVGQIVLNGVDIQMRDPSVSSVRDALVNALTHFGFENVRGSAAKAPTDDPNRSVIHIMVGTKQ